MTTEPSNQDIPPELLWALLDNPWDAVLLVDERGVVRFLSSSNEKFFGTTAEKAVGLHVLEVSPDSGLPRVISTGKPEIGYTLKYGTEERIVSRIPLRDPSGRIIGAVGKLMFWHPEQVKQLHKRVEVLEGRLQYYEKELKSIYSTRYSMENIIGESRLMQEAKRTAFEAARWDIGVLITGETGTGKEIFAHAIHQLSARRWGPFVRVNCASVPDELIESELFGYEAGAFTGARRQGKPGKFELADTGTIFLDEVGDMPMAMQAKLLRVLQEQEVERVGGTKTLSLDFRVIAATNRDLQTMVGEGTFRRDLFYRLNVFHLKIPPLRTVPEDIPRIGYYLLSQHRERNSSGPRALSADAMKILVEYDWPGNVRELGNVLERASIKASDGIIQEEDVPVEIVAQAVSALVHEEKPRSLKEEVALAERRAIERALHYANGSRTVTSELLGIHRSGLHQKMKRYGIDIK